MFNPNQRREINDISSGSSITNSEFEDSEGELGNNTVEMAGPLLRHRIATVNYCSTAVYTTIVS